ncbi:MAG: serine protease [Candidatus Gottesmanbacteria bacterium]
MHPDGLIVTNAHVISDDPAPKIIFSDYSFATARVIARYKTEDIAVVQVDKPSMPYVLLSDDAMLQSREEVFIIGFPMGTSFRGEPTIFRTQYIADRTFTEDPVTYIQMETGMDGGFSGSPVINACGDVVGIASMSTDAMSMAIKSSYILSLIPPVDSSVAIGQLPEEKRELNESFDTPADAVIAYYDGIRARRFRLAYDLLIHERTKDVPFEEWVKGYANTIDVAVISIDNNTEKEGTVFVRLRAIDLVGQDMVMSFYEGEWEVIKEDNAWKLGNSNIKTITDEPWWAWW